MSKSSRSRSKLSHPKMTARGSKWLCSKCNVYQYDSDKGDPLAGVVAGMVPQEFPKSWKCPICGAGKNKQIEIAEEDYH